MPGLYLENITELAAAPATGDWAYLVDVSETPDQGRRITVDNLVRQYLESQSTIDFTQATAITTTVGDLTLNPAGEIVASKNISIGANVIKTTNLSLKQESATQWAAKSADDAAYTSLQADTLIARTAFEGQVTGIVLQAVNADDGSLLFKARDNGVGRVEVARLMGAAEPYLGIGLDGEGVGIRTVKVTKAYTSALFNAAGLTDDDDVWAQPAGSVLLAVKMKMTAQFVAVGMTDLDITMGLAGDVDGLLVQAMNLTSDTVASQYTTRGAYWNEAAALGFLAKDAATTWRAYATAVGANLSTLSAGSIDFYFTYLDIP